MLRTLGVIKTDDNFKNGITRLSRFIFCPKQHVANRIHSLVTSMDNNFTGFQLRFGGKTSDTSESIQFLSTKQLPEIEQSVMNELLHGNVYISTDSSKVLYQLNERTNRSIYFINDFVRGHSSYSKTGNKTSIIMGSIIDMGVLSFSKKIYTTYWSSYGDMACFLSNNVCNYVTPLVFPFKSNDYLYYP